MALAIMIAAPVAAIAPIVVGSSVSCQQQVYRAPTP